MPTDTYSVIIKKPIEMVFNYVTTPGWWPIYHPTSKKVEPFVTHSLQIRESTVDGPDGQAFSFCCLPHLTYGFDG